MFVIRVGLLVIGLVVGVGIGAGQGQGGVAAPPSLAYTRADWPLPATSAAGFTAAWNFIEASSVAVTPRGTVLVLHRGAHPVLEFDSAGKFLRSWGEGLISEGKVAGIPKANWAPDRSRYSAVYGPAGCTACGAHAVRVDPEGHVWIVDASGHVVYKMNDAGKEMLRLGTRGVAGTGPHTFNLPTDVGFGPGGDVYVSDGYGGARVLKFSRQGKFLLQWGRRGTGPGEFGLPHNLVVDGQGRVYVSDRDNNRIQVFDANGKYLTEWKDTGGVSALGITRDGKVWTGATARDLNGRATGQLADVTGGHGVAIGEAGEVYLALLRDGVQKFVKR